MKVRRRSEHLAQQLRTDRLPVLHNQASIRLRWKKQLSQPGYAQRVEQSKNDGRNHREQNRDSLISFVAKSSRENTKGLSQPEDDQEKKSDLQPAVCSNRSELLGLEQSCQQVTQQQGAQNYEKSVLGHRCAYLQLFTSANIRNCDGEKHQRCKDKCQV